MKFPRIFVMLASLSVLFGQTAGASNLVPEQTSEAGKTAPAAQKKKGDHAVNKHGEKADSGTLSERFSDTPAGGNGGEPFDDQPYIPRKPTVACVDLHTGSWIDSIQTYWGNVSDRASLTNSQRHGGSGGKQAAVWIPKGEHIIAVEGHAGSLVSQLTIITNKTRYGPYGDGSSDRPFLWRAPKGYCVVGFQGRAGLGLDQLAPIYQRFQ